MELSLCGVQRDTEFKFHDYFHDSRFSREWFWSAGAVDKFLKHDDSYITTFTKNLEARIRIPSYDKALVGRLSSEEIVS